MTRKKALSGLSATSNALLILGVMGRYTGAVVVAVAVAVAAVAEEGAAAMLGGREGRKEGGNSRRKESSASQVRYIISLTSTSKVLL